MSHDTEESETENRWMIVRSIFIRWSITVHAWL